MEGLRQNSDWRKRHGQYEVEILNIDSSLKDLKTGMHHSYNEVLYSNKKVVTIL